MISVRFQGKPFKITSLCLEDLIELTLKKKDVIFIIGNWNAKVGSQEIPGVTGKFGLGVQSEAVQRLAEFCQENTLVIANTLSNNMRDDSTHGHHQMINTEIRLIIFSEVEDGDLLLFFLCHSFTSDSLQLQGLQHTGFLSLHQPPEFTQTHVH